LAIKENHRSYGDLEFEPEGRFRNTVRELCGLFVTIIDSKIYLLHQTAKEFLVQREPLDPASPLDHNNSHLQWKFSLWPRNSNRILAKICIWHLLFTDFETYPLGVYGDKNQYLNDHIFLDYSAKNWAAHFREAHVRTNSTMTRSVLKICDIHSKSCPTWFKIYWTNTYEYIDFPEHFAALMIASYFGLKRVVKLLLETDVDLNSTDNTYGRSALSWAAGEGHEAVVKQLLGKGAKADLKAIIKLLFKKGAKVNLKDKRGRTPLSWAAENGHEAVVKLLLEKGAELEPKDNNDRTPLSWAARNGHEAVVKLLLKKGAELDSKDNNGEAPLSWAARNGHEAVVKLLLKKGAELKSKDNNGQTPLSWAAGRGHEAVVKLLLESPTPRTMEVGRRYRGVQAKGTRPW
jgi:ankyrin repeat domain-containing protein 50